MTTEWITRLADDERRRDALRASEMEAAARKAKLAHLLGRRKLDDLRGTVIDDLDTFRGLFPGDVTREISLEAQDEGGFEIRKPGQPAASLTVAPRWDVATIGCRYAFASDNGLPARHDQFELVFVASGDDDARFRHENSGQVFPTAAALSEYLLTPVLTGRPR